MSVQAAICALCALSAVVLSAAQAPVQPGKVLPSWPVSYQMNMSTAIMICNNSGPVDPVWASKWSLVDIDWNSDKVDWSKVKPMNNEEQMLGNVQAIRRVNNQAITWVYRNGIKALPWFTSVRTKLEDPQYWGWFMPYANCSTAPGVYVCGPNATTNLYHDFEQTPSGDCGFGVQCGEYVFNHRNESLRSFLVGEYFFGPTGAGSPDVLGFYVDDGWSSQGPSEMDADAVAKMGMSKDDVQAMIAAWSANQQAWRDALVAAGRFEWFLFYGGQQTAPGWNQTDPAQTCLAYHRANCGPNSPSQKGTLFFGFSRVQHSQAWYPNGTLPYGEQDIAAFLLTRGPYAYLGYGWTGCADSKHPFTRPPQLDWDYGTPTDYCTEGAGNNGIFTRHWSKATISLDCNTFTASIDML